MTEKCILVVFSPVSSPLPVVHRQGWASTLPVAILAGPLSHSLGHLHRSPGQACGECWFLGPTVAVLKNTARGCCRPCPWRGSLALSLSNMWCATPSRAVGCVHFSLRCPRGGCLRMGLLVPCTWRGYTPVMWLSAGGGGVAPQSTPPPLGRPSLPALFCPTVPVPWPMEGRGRVSLVGISSATLHVLVATAGQ